MIRYPVAYGLMRHENELINAKWTTARCFAVAPKDRYQLQTRFSTLLKVGALNERAWWFMLEPW
jgi:hypothetical protein